MKLLVKKYPATKLRLKTESVWNYFMSLKGQCILIKHGIEVSMVKDIKSWQTLVKRSLVNIHNFCRRYFICESC